MDSNQERNLHINAKNWIEQFVAEHRTLDGRKLY